MDGVRQPVRVPESTAVHGWRLVSQPPGIISETPAPATGSMTSLRAAPFAAVELHSLLVQEEDMGGSSAPLCRSKSPASVSYISFRQRPAPYPRAGHNSGMWSNFQFHSLTQNQVARMPTSLFGSAPRCLKLGRGNLPKAAEQSGVLQEPGLASFRVTLSLWDRPSVLTSVAPRG